MKTTPAIQDRPTDDRTAERLQEFFKQFETRHADWFDATEKQIHAAKAIIVSREREAHIVARRMIAEGETDNAAIQKAIGDSPIVQDADKHLMALFAIQSGKNVPKILERLKSEVHVAFAHCKGVREALNNGRPDPSGMDEYFELHDSCRRINEALLLPMATYGKRRKSGALKGAESNEKQRENNLRQVERSAIEILKKPSKYPITKRTVLARAILKNYPELRLKDSAIRTHLKTLNLPPKI